MAALSSRDAMPVGKTSGLGCRAGDKAGEEERTRACYILAGGQIGQLLGTLTQPIKLLLELRGLTISR